MKHIISIAIFLIAALTSAAQQDSTATANTAPATAESMEPETVPGRLAQQADSAYAADNFSLAERLYRESIAAEGTSSTICYNLGNAYYRQGNLGMAIVNYERALKLDPTNKDARINLDFVKGKITDRQIDSGSLDCDCPIRPVPCLGAHLSVLVGGAGQETEFLRRTYNLPGVRTGSHHIVRCSQPDGDRQVRHHTPPLGPAFHHSPRGTQPVGRGIPAPRRH